MKTLIAYYSGKGFIRETAEKLKKGLEEKAVLLDLGQKAKIDPAEFDSILICGAFRAGRLPGKVRQFANKHETVLLNKKLAFVLGGLDTEKYEEPFKKNIPENLRAHAFMTIHAGGQFIPEDYKLFIRKMMEKINKGSGPVHKEQWDRLNPLIETLNASS